MLSNTYQILYTNNKSYNLWKQEYQITALQLNTTVSLLINVNICLFICMYIDIHLYIDMHLYIDIFTCINLYIHDILIKKATFMKAFSCGKSFNQ